jgi:hypothetical protein
MTMSSKLFAFLKALDFLTSFLALTAVVRLVVSPVFADPVPMPPIYPDWFAYTVEALVGETVAWVIGAELLWRLSKKRKQEISRVESYKIMLLAMIISFSIGLLFWKIFGWI